MSDVLSLLRSQRALSAEVEPPLGLDEYQSYASGTDKNPTTGLNGLSLSVLGIFGEAGSLLSEFKKKQRDRDSYVAYEAAVVEEVGDFLWYLANAAYRGGITFSEVAGKALGKDVTSFAELDPNASRVAGPHADPEVEKCAMAFAASVGDLVRHVESGRVPNNIDALRGVLIDIFRALVRVAAAAGINLATAARENLTKTRGRWPANVEWGALYDEMFPSEEQLPRTLSIEIFERNVGGKLFAYQRCNGIFIGDRLTDNREPDDDYRFHDAFHLAYAAVLGWSPVVRGLLKLKRKSDPRVDDIQDGARASLIEEGIATMVFNHGLRNNLYATIDSVDTRVLKTIAELVVGFEVENRPAWQWERAILTGFEAFRGLKEHRGGILQMDLNARTLTFKAPQH